MEACNHYLLLLVVLHILSLVAYRSQLFPCVISWEMLDFQLHYSHQVSYSHTLLGDYIPFQVSFCVYEFFVANAVLCVFVQGECIPYLVLPYILNLMKISFFLGGKLQGSHTAFGEMWDFLMLDTRLEPCNHILLGPYIRTLAF